MTDPVRVLTVNAGSSSLKVRLLDADDLVVQAEDVPVEGGRFDAVALSHLVRELPMPDAVAHRVVHGGERFTGPVLVEDDVRRELETLIDLAPLHQPLALAALDAVSRALPGVPAVACLDTAFHLTLPAAASTYAVPEQWRSRWGVRRFGFHGLSHADASRAAARLIGEDVVQLRTVVCHLGAGASLCAVRGGRSVDTTMGFTPLEGLVMATRSGSIDPGLVLWLQEHGGMSAARLADDLEHRSGLLGLTGCADMRVVVERAAAGDERAVLGLEVYVHHLVAGVAAMTASLGGIDLLVFTGGVGERSPEVRRRTVAALEHLGMSLDLAANAAVTEGDVSSPDSVAAVVVVHAREDREMAAQSRRLLRRD